MFHNTKLFLWYRKKIFRRINIESKIKLELTMILSDFKKFFVNIRNFQTRSILNYCGK